LPEYRAGLENLSVDLDEYTGYPILPYDSIFPHLQRVRLPRCSAPFLLSTTQLPMLQQLVSPDLPDGGSLDFSDHRIPGFCISVTRLRGNIALPDSLVRLRIDPKSVMHAMKSLENARVRDICYTTERQENLDFLKPRLNSFSKRDEPLERLELTLDIGHGFVPHTYHRLQHLVLNCTGSYLKGEFFPDLQSLRVKGRVFSINGHFSELCSLHVESGTQFESLRDFRAPQLQEILFVDAEHLEGLYVSRKMYPALRCVTVMLSPSYIAGAPIDGGKFPTLSKEEDTGDSPSVLLRLDYRTPQTIIAELYSNRRGWIVEKTCSYTQRLYPQEW